MSKLTDKLRQVSQAAPQPMGFRLGQLAPSKPQILLIAGLTEAKTGNVADLVSGADAGLVPMSRLEEGTKTLRKCSQEVPDIPWGGWLRGIGAGEIKSVKKADWDFVIFPAESTALEAFPNTKLGKILEVKASLSGGLLSTIDELPVDAVLIANESEDSPFLTWQQLMQIRRFADRLAKPLLVPVPLEVTAHELEVLWGAGVDCLVVEVGMGQPSGALRELREVIGSLTFPSPRKRGRVRALLPQVGSEGTEVEIETEEE